MIYLKHFENNAKITTFCPVDIHNYLIYLYDDPKIVRRSNISLEIITNAIMDHKIEAYCDHKMVFQRDLSDYPHHIPETEINIKNIVSGTVKEVREFVSGSVGVEFTEKKVYEEGEEADGIYVIFKNQKIKIFGELNPYKVVVTDKHGPPKIDELNDTIENILIKAEKFKRQSKFGL